MTTFQGEFTMKKKLAVSFCSVTLIVSASFALLGFDKQNYVLSQGGRIVMATHAPSHVTASPQEDPGLKVIYSNMSKYPLATFFSVFGYTIAQGGSNFPFQTWYAVAFTPTASATVTKIEVAAGRLGSGTAGFEIALYDDASGVPGKVIKRLHVAHPLSYGQCCVLTAVTDGAGIPVSAGTRYWVALTTTTKDVDLYGWNFNTTTMQASPAAQWCGNSTTYCGSNNNKWNPQPYVQTAMAVLGH
jgi:hypothetical protein